MHNTATPSQRAALPSGAILREAASRYAVYGVLIAAAAVVIATLLVAWLTGGHINIAAIANAQRSNYALWTMDAMPFIFAIWGQYASLRMAREATALVSEKTQHLHQALEEAQYTNQVKTDFFARMSHELRTPLNAIVGMSELLAEPASPAEARWHAKVVRESAEKLLTLINDVLDVAKIEADRLELQAVEFNLRECIGGAIALLQDQALRKGLAMRTELAPELPTYVFGDPGRLHQIVVNLVGNAIKYTNQGEVTFTVRPATATDGGNVMLRIEVADTGIGIPESARRDLFKPYRHAGQEAIRRGGTGLGLAITRELVQAMGGKIGVASQVGRGSTFWCTLRMRQCAQPTTTTQAQTVSLAKKRVLLADPNQHTRRALADQLRALGLHVQTAAYSADALAAVREVAGSNQFFDLILLDMFLPGMGGEELGLRLAEMPGAGEALIAVITSAGARGDVERMAREGFAAYLTRPIGPSELKPLLCKIFALRQLSAKERERIGLITRHSDAVTTPADNERNRVLLVEDSDAGRAVALRQLSALGLSVDIALDGREALEAAARVSYGAILLDLQLPDISGIEVLHEIRMNGGEAAATPIVIMTAGATDEEHRACRELGANEVVTKPVPQPLLRETLAEWLDFEPVTQDGEARPVPDATTTHRSDPEMVRIFLRESDQRMIAIRSAGTSEAHRRQMARNAHTMSSTSRYFGDLQTSRAAGRVEALAPDAPEAELGPTIEALYQAYGELRQRLRREIDALAAGNGDATSGRGASRDDGDAKTLA